VALPRVALPRRLAAIVTATILTAAIVALPFLIAAGPARAATPVIAPSITIDGPSASIEGISGLSVSRDGTGGLVYLKSVAGVAHVFLSALAGGELGSPVEVDAALGGASSQPVLAAGDGGLLLIAFINGGDLYVVSRASASAPLSAPTDLYGGALNPAIELSIHSEGYLAFTVADGSGYDVRDFYYYAGQWQLESGALNETPADDAGTGAGAPKVAAAGDGEGIVAWGENGHIYVRRVWYAMTSYEADQADVPSMAGFSEVSADSPAVGIDDDSSFANVAFREEFTNGTQTISRVLVNRLVGEEFTGAAEADGQSFASGPGATAPQLAVMQYGNGFVTSELQGSNQVWATVLGQNGATSGIQRIDSLPNAGPSYPTPAIAGDYSGLIAWQQAPGPLGGSEIHARFYSDSSFGPELVASDPSLGSTNAAQGLFAAGDHGGDVAIAYVQGSGPTTMVEVSELVQPPGSFRASSEPHYRTTTTPLLTWSAPRELWGPLDYGVTIDGVAAGSTSGVSFRPAVPLSQGPHTFQVTAENVHGLASPASPAGFFVDSIPPAAKFTLNGAEREHALLHLRVRYTDTPPGLRPADASGVAKVVVQWGDGTSSRIGRQTGTHRYLRAGRYLLKITIADRAGNRTVLARRLRIATP